MRERVLTTLINLRDELVLYQEAYDQVGFPEDTVYLNQLMYAIEILEGLVGE